MSFNLGTRVQRLRELVGAKLTLGDGALLSLLLVLASISLWPDRRLAANCLHSDVQDYALPALSFLQGHGFVIIVEGQKYPPYHLFGLSLMMAPAYAAFGPNLGNGIYSVFVLGLGMVVLTYYLAKRLFDRRIAFFACLFLILADQLRWYSKIIGTDGAASVFFCLAANIILLKALQDPRSPLWAWLLLGQVVGFSVLVRPENILMVVPIGGCLLAEARARRIHLTRVLLASTGIMFFLGIWLLTNYLYTGDCFRTQYQVNQSEVHDRLGGSTSWSYLLNPNFQKSNLRRILVGAQYQWSCVDGETNQLKKVFYLVANLFLAAGIVRVLIGSRQDRRDLHLWVWVLLWVGPLVLFFSCSFLSSGSRSMQRAVPYLCILNGVGLVALWDLMARLRAPFGALLDRLGAIVHVRLRPCVALLQLRTVFAGLMVAWGGYVFLHPSSDPSAWVPISARLERVNRLIPEKDAVIISNCNPFYAEHFLVSNTARMLIPLHRYITDADFYVQWKKPPHPEWINEDFPDRSRQGTSVMYKRQRENGAQFIFPYTVDENPEVIENALRAGRKVYYVGPGGHTRRDLEVLARLSRQTYLQMVEGGFYPTTDVPERYRARSPALLVVRVSGMRNLGTELRMNADGQVWEGDRVVWPQDQ